MSNPKRTVQPVMCLLSTKGEAAQVLAWRDLSTLALEEERLLGGVALTFPLDLADRIDDLVEREVGCCGSWLSIETTRTDETVQLQAVTSNPDGVNILHEMLDAKS